MEELHVCYVGLCNCNDFVRLSLDPFALDCKFGSINISHPTNKDIKLYSHHTNAHMYITTNSFS